MNFGNALKVVRKNAGYKNQREAAKALKASQSYYSQLENNRRFPSKNILDRISETFKVPIAIIFWFSLEEKELEKDKRHTYRTLKPLVDKCVSEMYDPRSQDSHKHLV